jgi:predicted dehydrogenase
MHIEAFSELQVRTKESEQVWKETYASTWKTTLEGRGFAGQIKHFFDCVQARKKPMTDGWDSVKTQRMLEAMIAKAVG